MYPWEAGAQLYHINLGPVFPDTARNEAPVFQAWLAPDAASVSFWSWSVDGRLRT